MPALVTTQLSTLTLVQPTQSKAVPRETEIVTPFHDMCFVPVAETTVSSIETTTSVPSVIGAGGRKCISPLSESTWYSPGASSSSSAATA